MTDVLAQGTVNNDGVIGTIGLGTLPLNVTMTSIIPEGDTQEVVCTYPDGFIKWHQTTLNPGPEDALRLIVQVANTMRGRYTCGQVKLVGDVPAIAPGTVLTFAQV